MGAKTEKIKELKNNIDRSINEYPEAWTVIGVSAAVILLAAYNRKRKAKKNGLYLVVTSTPDTLAITNLSKKKAIVIPLVSTDTLRSYAVKIA